MRSGKLRLSIKMVRQLSLLALLLPLILFGRQPEELYAALAPSTDLGLCDREEGEALPVVE